MTSADLTMSVSDESAPGSVPGSRTEIWQPVSRVRTYELVLERIETQIVNGELPLASGCRRSESLRSCSVSAAPRCARPCACLRPRESCAHRSGRVLARVRPLTESPAMPCLDFYAYTSRSAHSHSRTSWR